jgi:hypothetical protein
MCNRLLFLTRVLQLHQSDRDRDEGIFQMEMEPRASGTTSMLGLPIPTARDRSREEIEMLEQLRMKPDVQQRVINLTGSAYHDGWDSES